MHSTKYLRKILLTAPLGEKNVGTKKTGYSPLIYYSMKEVQYYSTLITSVISGANCLMVFSTPNFMVEKLIGHPLQLPCSFT